MLLPVVCEGCRAKHKGYRACEWKSKSAIIHRWCGFQYEKLRRIRTPFSKGIVITINIQKINSTRLYHQQTENEIYQMQLLRIAMKTKARLKTWGNSWGGSHCKLKLQQIDNSLICLADLTSWHTAEHQGKPPPPRVRSQGSLGTRGPTADQHHHQVSGRLLSQKDNSTLETRFYTFLSWKIIIASPYLDNTRMSSTQDQI